MWQGSQVLAEHNGSTGAVVTDYVYSGSRMIAKVASGSAQYFLSDRLSARMTLDSSGTVLGRQAHLPFGEDVGESGTQEKHHLTSYERDSDTSTDYAINRQYAQSVGRFMQADPYRASGGVIAPQSWNRYSYVQNMPVNAVDPLGLFLGHVWADPSFCIGQYSAFARPSFHLFPLLAALTLQLIRQRHRCGGQVSVQASWK